MRYIGIVWQDRGTGRLATYRIWPIWSIRHVPYRIRRPITSDDICRWIGWVAWVMVLMAIVYVSYRIGG